MSVQAESFQQAWTSLASPGLDLTRASFEIGWELAHLARLAPPPPDGGTATALPGAGAAAPDVTTRAPVTADEKTAAAANPCTEILSVRDLPPLQDMQVRVERIEAALWYFNTNPNNEIPASANAPIPSVDSLKGKLTAGNIDVCAELQALHTGMIMACAALDGITTGGASNSAAIPAINGLKEAYEVGRLLAVIVLEAGHADDPATFLSYISVDVAKLTSRKEESAAYRAHSLLGGLKGCFPSAAAHSVARNLEDWSNWANNPSAFDLAQARIAISGQGRVWRAILSGQTFARDYIVATSITDAANRLFVNWATSATAIARSFLRTALARFFLALGVIVLLVFFGAFLVDFLTQGAATSGAKNGLTITAVLAAVGSAAGIFHVSRTQVTTILDDIWGMVEPSMIEAELVESIALSTRRLPSDTIGGASPPPTMTMKARFERARKGSLPSAAGTGSKRPPPPDSERGRISAPLVEEHQAAGDGR
jgi:hypothetical protein